MLLGYLRNLAFVVCLVAGENVEEKKGHYQEALTQLV